MQPSLSDIKTTPGSRTRNWPGFIFEIFLLALIVLGIVFRFSWVDWSQGASLHPDEYGLTNTLTALSMPKTIGDYFNTRLSAISPYEKYDLAGNPIADGPDNRLRWGQWPIIIIRWLGESSGNTGYDEIRLMGRRLSALADTLSLLLIFLIGQRLFSRRIGLLAAALSSLAVMQIQQSHFMTVDNFGVLFTMLCIYACVRIAQKACVVRRTSGDPDQQGSPAESYQPERSTWTWYVLFGAAFGMALSSKINLAPLAGMSLIAAFISIADLKLRSKKDIARIFWITAGHLALAFIVMLLTFRITQPMSFRASTGDTTLLTLHLNPDWVESMKVAASESSGVGGGPPAEQWANRPAILFPLMNMVMWGLGLPLGLAAWAGFLWAAWKLFRSASNWRTILLPFVWVGGYFLFMGTRWVKSIRYFLPIYPFLCLFAAFGLAAFWNWSRERVNQAESATSTGRSSSRAGLIRQIAAGLAAGIVIIGTLLYANAFTSAVYRQDHTRIQASRWMYQNIPAPFQIQLKGTDGSAYSEPVPAPDDLIITSTAPFSASFTSPVDGLLDQIALSHAVSRVAEETSLKIQIALDPQGKQIMGQVNLTIPAPGGLNAPGAVHASFRNVPIQKNLTYYLIASAQAGAGVRINRTVVSNESWDEGLPVRIDNYDPFGMFYHGLTMEVRWYDDAKKKEMFLDNLAQVDYIIVPSQRAIWSADRIPLTYPMTMEYYRALFDGRLGFDQVASFSAPMQIGPLSISDVGGTFAWGSTAKLPLFNYNPLAAEEAFSVYDHPPVWVFKKRADFDITKARQILDAIDLNQVIIQSPRDATMIKP